MLIHGFNRVVNALNYTFLETEIYVTSMYPLFFKVTTKEGVSDELCKYWSS